MVLSTPQLCSDLFILLVLIYVSAYSCSKQAPGVRQRPSLPCTFEELLRPSVAICLGEGRALLSDMLSSLVKFQ